MDYVNKLEKTLAVWYKDVPHLPKNARTWVVENIWWMSLVGVVLLVCGLFVIIPLLFTALALSSTASVVSPYVPYYQNTLGFAWVALLVNVISYVATAILLANAVTPLKEKSKKGWNLIFLSYVISFVLNIVSAVMMYSVFNVFGAIFSAAIGGYFLFEIRDHYVAKHHVVAHKKVAKKA